MISMVKKIAGEMKSCVVSRGKRTENGELVDEGSLLGIFVFFNYFDIVSASLKVKKDRCDVYEAIIFYAKTGKVPTFQKEKVKNVFDIILPMIKKQRKNDLKKMREGDAFAKTRNKKSVRDNKKDGCRSCKNIAQNVQGVAIGEMPQASTLSGKLGEMIDSDCYHEENCFSQNEVLQVQEINNKKNISKERERVKKEKEKFETSLNAGSEKMACDIEEAQLPTIEEIEAVICEKKLKVVAGVFFHFYNGKGWKINGRAFDWREKLLEWECRKAGRESENFSKSCALGRGVTPSGRVKLLNERECVVEDIDNTEFDKLLAEMGL